MKIHALDRKTMSMIGDRIDHDLVQMGQDCGLQVRVKRLSYEALTATVTLEIGVLQAADGKPAAQVTWEQYATVLGLKSEWFGWRFLSNGKAYTLSGLDISKPSRNVHATYQGKTYLFRSTDLVRMFATRPPVKP